MDDNLNTERRSLIRPLFRTLAAVFAALGLYAGTVWGIEAGRKAATGWAYSRVEQDLAARNVEVDPKGRTKAGRELSRQDLMAAVAVLSLRLDQERFRVQGAADILGLPVPEQMPN